MIQEFSQRHFHEWRLPGILGKGLNKAQCKRCNLWGRKL